jgi:hypothetical protein
MRAILAIAEAIGGPIKATVSFKAKAANIPIVIAKPITRPYLVLKRFMKK